MPELYWFAVTTRYECLTCHTKYIEKMGVDSPTQDANAINQKLSREKLWCKKCDKPLTPGSPVFVEVQPATPESLQAAGFPLPPDYAKGASN